MQELHDGLEKAKKTLEDCPAEQSAVEGSMEAGGILDVTLRKWADYSFRTFTEPLLGKAIAISVAIAEFRNELERGR